MESDFSQGHTEGLRRLLDSLRFIVEVLDTSSQVEAHRYTPA
jgi:hypothetical protein